MSAKINDGPEKDLFSQIQTVDKTIRKKTGIFLPRTRNSINISYENIIFLMIGFVMVSIIFFSLGVEKGRHDKGRVLAEEAATAAQAEIVTNEVSLIEEKKEEKRPSGYIIQIAAFKQKEAALDELGRLKKAGHGASLKKDGNYYYLYIGYFDRKENAQKIQKELKKKYADCYIIAM